MSTSTDGTSRWTEVTITVGTGRFDGVIDPRNNAVYVRLKSLTDHLHIDYHGQYYKLTHDPAYEQAVHIRDGKVQADHAFLRHRSSQGRQLRDYLYLTISLVEQYLKDLKPDRIRNAEGRAFARMHKDTLVESIRRGFEKQRTTNRGTGRSDSTTLELETLIRRHFDQAQAIVQRMLEERRQEAERQRQEQERREREQRRQQDERLRQERARREQEQQRQEQQRRRPRRAEPDPWWTALGVAVTATQPEVERRYRELALLHHPDRGGDPEQMKAINQAIDRARKSFADAGCRTR
jgi:hypothetical protein